MTAATGKLRPCLTLAGSLQTKGRPTFHSWPKCAAAAKQNVHSNEASSFHDGQEQQAAPDRGRVGVDETHETATLNELHKGRKVLQVRGVSVIYQQSATSLHRRKKSENPAQQGANSFTGFPRRPAGPITAKPGGSVVASMSATEVHRQKRRAERTPQAKDTVKTNPSTLKLPVSPEDDRLFGDTVGALAREHETTTTTREEVQKKNASVMNLRTTTIGVVTVSSVIILVSSLPL